ncbi:SulP family inorganic anion transporter [Pseudaquabacterium pictum]|uniref:Sulfate transporter n=1 Tax=Pseudaquabacterium pictum TaxID=2315236 RepID=A0A480AN06_9BURK|nr:SulP family inorganic anion transporter [Rubrivivax pictus]GCL62130.1 sulfate transporter [Rubrivivax pictus]
MPIHAPTDAPPQPPLALRLWPWLGQLSAASWRGDIQAGLLGALLVLPQGIAFAALAGLPPAMGLAAAALPCAVAALGGASRHVMSGPTNATALALGAMLVPLAAGDPSLLLPLALGLTLLVGLLQIGLAVARLGTLANFVSPAVMLGFTTGAAGLIAWYAVAGLLGAEGRVSPWQAWQHGVAPSALAVGGLTLVAALAGRRWWRSGPYLLLALLLGIAAGWWCTRHPLPGPLPLLVGSPPSALPQWRWPWEDADRLLPLGSPLLQAALALTIVALGQSMAIAKTLATRTGDALDANRECLGQGLGNLAAACSGGMVVCGSLNRSVPNLEAGARTPMAAVAASLLLVLLVALAGPVLAWIPLAAVAGLLLTVAWSLFDHAAWRRVWRDDASEFAVAAATALATLTVQLEMAVLAGVMLSLVVYLYRSARPALRTMGFDRQGAGRPFVILGDVGDVGESIAPPPGTLPECPQLKLLRMEGSVWFGAVTHVADRLRGLRERAAASPTGQRHLLVMAKSMNTIDLAAAEMWETERSRRAELGGALYFHRPRPQVLALWQRTGFLDRLGRDHVFPDKRRAIATIVPQLDGAVCSRCRHRVFEECVWQPGAPIDAGL